MPLATEYQTIHLIANFSIGAAGLGCLYLLFAAIAVLRFPTRRQTPAISAVPLAVTILKPLCGAEPGLLDRLGSFSKQDYDGPVQIVCGLMDRADPAAALVTACEFSGVELVLNPRRHGRNCKVSNLVNVVSQARHDVLLISDSDIEVGPDHLTNVIAALQTPGVGAVTCLYHGVPAGGLWAQQAALAINSHFLPNVVTAISFGLAQPCFGSTIAIRRDMLARIGGLKTFADCLADDYAIGEAVRASGARVAILSHSVGHVCFEDSLPSLLAHEIRVARTIRSIDPIGYCGTIFNHPFSLGLLGALLGGQDGLLLATFGLACRALLCLCVEHAFALKRQPYWLLPMAELLTFFVFVRGLLGSTVTWRGADHRVDQDGRLMPINMRHDHDADALPPGTRL